MGSRQTRRDRGRGIAGRGEGSGWRCETGAVRVVSLVPSVTETLVAWGVVPIACTRFCEQPGIATVGGTKNPDVAAVVALEPDLVVMDEEENRRQDYQALVGAGVAVHVLAVRNLADVPSHLSDLAERVGIAVDIPVPGPTLPQRARALVPIWRRPWMVLGLPTYGASVLAHLGVPVVFPDSRGAYPTVSVEEMAAQVADVVLAPSEPYPFRERHRAELAELGGGAPVVLVDGKDLFWWGVRTAPALARLAQQIATVRTDAAAPGATPIS